YVFCNYFLPLYFFLMRRPPPNSTLFPYTTLFRSYLALAQCWASLLSSCATRFRKAPAGSLFMAERRKLKRSCAMSKSRLKGGKRSEEHTSELQSPCNLVCRLLLEKKNKKKKNYK